MLLFRVRLPSAMYIIRAVEISCCISNVHRHSCQLATLFDVLISSVFINKTFGSIEILFCFATNNQKKKKTTTKVNQNMGRHPPKLRTVQTIGVRDFSKICRFCMNHSETLKPIFKDDLYDDGSEMEADQSITKMFVDCLNIAVSRYRCRWNLYSMRTEWTFPYNYLDWPRSSATPFHLSRVYG